MNETKSTCCYCGVGCGVVIESDGNRITGVRGDPDHPANFGRLCTKGATLHLSTRPETRALFPELRAGRDQPRARVSWERALDHAAERFAAIIRNDGPDAVAFYISGQLLTEDYYVFNKLARAVAGTNNVDSNSRLCMSSAVAGYKLTLGVDAPPACYEDIAHTDCLLIAGSNTAWAHPIVFRRIEDAKRANPAMKIIVVDPRRTDTATFADLHLPILPGSDIVLFNSMLNVLLWEGLIDSAYIRAHTEGFEALREAVRETTPAVAAAVCGVPAQDIVTAARCFGNARAALSMWCQGLNQSIHGTYNNAALIHLHLATGQIGRAGAGPFSLTGQPNAMGGREVGAMANLASAHRDLADPNDRAEIARLWDVPSIPDQPGKTAVELFEAIRQGEIKAVWIACTNPAQSLPDQDKVSEALGRAEFVVLQEAYRNTETADWADLLLPAASWGEKEGTVTNSERRISHVRRAVAPPGEARPDWQIARDFAVKLGHALGQPQVARLFPYFHPEQIFREHALSTRGRDLDISGLYYDVLDTLGPQQWPFPEGASGGQPRLYADGRYATPTGKARFTPLPHELTAERTDARLPLHLTTGRLRDQWHGMSRTGKVGQLFNHVAQAYIELNADDMARRGIEDGDLVRVLGRRGAVVLRAAASESLRPGQSFVPMHWGRRYLSNAGSNALTAGAIDPISKQPELKHAAVNVEKANLPWQALALRCAPGHAQPDSRALMWLERLQPYLERFAHASLGLAGRDLPVVVLRIAHDEPIPEPLLAEIDAVLGLDGEECLSYRDARRGIGKRALIVEGALAGVRLTGEIAAGNWLEEAMIRRLPTDELRRWLFAPLATPPATTTRRGRVICNCFDVAESEIAAEIAAGRSLEDLQQKLRCGTSCGSCLPELRRMMNASRQAA
jgi:assimilatory nitrate reductase catalytic subunit